MQFDSSAHNHLTKNKLLMLDIGSRSGITQEWNKVKNYVNVLPIDAAQDAEGESVLIGGPDSKYETFHHTRFPYSSGIIKGTKKFLSRFMEPVPQNLEVIGTEMIKTQSIDDYISKEEFPEVNFLKIDTEGNEHHILEGAQNVLKSRTLLAVKSEVWLGPIKDETEFSRIDRLLRKHNFHLFDLDFARYTRSSLPYGVMADVNQNCSMDKLGQYLTGDVVYIKDPIWDKINNKDLFDWNDLNIMKLALIYYVYSCNDCALELIIYYENNFDSQLDFTNLKNSFTPALPNGDRITYKQYIKKTERCRYDYSGMKRLWKKKI